MNENLLLIICAVGVVALIYLIRYIIAKVVYKGTDAIEKTSCGRLSRVPALRATKAWRSGWAFPGRIPRLSSPTRLRPRSLFRLSPVTLPISR